MVSLRKFAVWIVAAMTVVQGLAPAALPSLQTQGDAVQLIVDRQPFLILGGELGNSSASSLAYLEPIWPKLARMNLNTVLAPVYWDLIEPEEGVFDFTLIDGLIAQARQHDMRLVLLWSASWKNSVSCYVPSWVKTDAGRFPRARLRSGQAMEMLSAFSNACRDADQKAFVALMRHLHAVDGRTQTVIMIQVENEVGMLKDARDHSDAANRAFERPVPRELIDYLIAHKASLSPEVRERWEAGGFAESGNWEAIFGKGLWTDELFMAWYYARYVEAVAAAGKAEYPLPMFVNAALMRPNTVPGQYPSAGPLPHVFDIWRAGAPSIDFFSPDIYFPDFARWCQAYHQPGNPLFIPEALLNDDAAVHALYAVGAHDAMGFSPFSIESETRLENAPIAAAYRLLAELSPQILELRGKGRTAGVLLDKESPVQTVTLGGYVLTASHDYTWSWSGGDTEAPSWPRAGAIIMAVNDDAFIIAGSGVIVTFSPDPPDRGQAGIVSVLEKIDAGENGWRDGRFLSGDQTHQGRHLRLPSGAFGIQHITLYPYE